MILFVRFYRRKKLKKIDKNFDLDDFIQDFADSSKFNLNNNVCKFLPILNPSLKMEGLLKPI